MLLKGPNVFVGYYKQEEATREAIDADGWLHTGDAGFIDQQGHLVIIDRAKDVGKLADGTAFAPQFIENKLKFSPYIREAVAFGDERPFVAGDDRDRHADGGHLGRAARARLHLLHGPQPQGRGARR